MPIIVSEENKKTKVLDSSVNIEVIDGDPMPDQDPDNKKIPTGDATATPQDIMAGKTAYAKAIKLTGTYHPLDTSDATATSSDIVMSKTAYVDGVKIEGILYDRRNPPWDTVGLTSISRLEFSPNSDRIDYKIDGSTVTNTVISFNTRFNAYSSKTFLRNALGITADKIKEGETILEVQGTVKDTSDATATAEDIIKDKTAYVNNEKIIGTFQVFDNGGNFCRNIRSYTLDRVNYLAFDSIFLSNAIGFRKNGFWTVNCNYTDLANYINLTPDKLKKDETILGVTGTLQGPTLQDKTIDPSTVQKTIVPDTEYNGLSSVTINPVTSNVDQNIKEQNIKKGVTILGVEGNYIGEAVNAIYSLEYNSLDGNLYSVASDGTTRTPYELEDDNLYINIGDDDILVYSIVDNCLEVVIDG